jgi:cell division transport system permease protein
VALKVDYAAREVMTNLRRNLLLTTASMLTVAVSLSIVAVALFLRYGVDNATQRWQNGVEFEVFLNVDATAEQVALIQRQLDEHPGVDQARFINREEQYGYFRDYFHDQPEYLENVRAEDLPESFRVRPSDDDANVIETTGSYFATQPGVQEVAFAKDQVDRAFRTSRALQVGMFVIAVVLFFASSLLIFNTIRMAIFARRREIEVMKLVGATNWFIRVPFMVEGLLQGAIGAAAAFAAIFYLRSPLADWILDNFDQFEGFLVRDGQVLGIGLLVVVVGSAIGAVSAGVAVTRFLDV